MATINHKKYDEATETFKDFNVYDGKETLIFKVNGEAGNVGIGTTSSSLFGTSGFGRVLGVVASSGYATVQIGGSSGYGGEIDLGAGSIRHGAVASIDGSHLAFYTNSTNSGDGVTERMRITAAGNIGIGTDSPAAKLHLYGAYPELRLDGNSDVSGSGFLSFYRPTGGRDAYIQSGSNGLLIDAVSNTIFSNGASERMRITSAGYVGIGTSSPNAPLEILSNAAANAIRLRARTANDYSFIQFANNASSEIVSEIFSQRTGANIARLGFSTANGAGSIERMTISPAGNVGIGTSAPTSILNLSSATPILTLNQTTINSEQGIEFDVLNVNYAYIRGNAQTGLVSYAAGLSGGAGYVHRFIVDGSEKLRITPDGLTFNGDTAAANALDDYEEGTWTPTVGGTWTTNPTNLYGYYIKIGNIVHIRLNFSGGVKASATAGWFDGLPFSGADSGGGTVSNVSVQNKGIALLDNSTRVWVTENDFGGLGTKVKGSYLL